MAFLTPQPCWLQASNGMFACLSVCLCFHSTAILSTHSSPIHSRGWGCLLALPPPDVPLGTIYPPGQTRGGGAHVYSVRRGISSVHAITTKSLPFTRPPGATPACHVPGTCPRGSRTVFSGSRFSWSCSTWQGTYVHTYDGVEGIGGTSWALNPVVRSR